MKQLSILVLATLALTLPACSGYRSKGHTNMNTVNAKAKPAVQPSAEVLATGLSNDYLVSFTLPSTNGQASQFQVDIDPKNQVIKQNDKVIYVAGQALDTLVVQRSENSQLKIYVFGRQGLTAGFEYILSETVPSADYVGQLVHNLTAYATCSKTSVSDQFKAYKNGGVDDYSLDQCLSSSNPKTT